MQESGRKTGQRFLGSRQRSWTVRVGQSPRIQYDMLCESSGKYDALGFRLKFRFGHEAVGKVVEVLDCGEGGRLVMAEGVTPDVKTVDADP